MAGRDRISNTPTMTTSPPPTRYHRWLGWYAPAMRRAVIVSSIGLTVVVVLVWFLPVGDGRGRRLGRRRAHLPAEHLADDPAARRRPGRPAGHARGRDPWHG